MNAEVLLRVIITVASFVLSCTVHEWAHAWMANRLGDPTPRTQGRLTLNPSVHVDPVGTILFPALGAVIGAGFLGWGKPVEFRPNFFRRDVAQGRGILLYAVAGPVANVVLATLSVVAVVAASYFGALAPGSIDTVRAFLTFASSMVAINVILAVFNLLPIPPLDGHKMLAGWLGFSHPAVRFVEEHQLLLFIGLLFTGQWIVGIPAGFIMNLLTAPLGG